MKILEKSKISDFKVVNEKTIRQRPFLNLLEKEFRKRIVGKRITKVSRRAKNIVFEVDRYYLVFHLKMTGQLVLKKCASKGCKIITGGHPIVGQGNILPNKYTRGILDFDNGSVLYFNDVRRFGWARLMDKTEYLAFSDLYGLEPLSKEFTSKYLKNFFDKRKKTTIKQAIMDQKYLVGVGNIYADESLFLAGIRPARKVESLSDKEIEKLHKSIIKTLKQAIKYRGTSFNDYLDAQGAKGNFLQHLKVYGRAGKECRKCGGVIKKGKIGGRGTHWCDNCQL